MISKPFTRLAFTQTSRPQYSCHASQLCWHLPGQETDDRFKQLLSTNYSCFKEQTNPEVASAAFSFHSAFQAAKKRDSGVRACVPAVAGGWLTGHDLRVENPADPPIKTSRQKPGPSGLFARGSWVLTNLPVCLRLLLGGPGPRASLGPCRLVDLGIERKDGHHQASGDHSPAERPNQN